MDAQPDTSPHDPINALYDAALDLQRAFSPGRYDDQPRSAALLPHLKRAGELRARLLRADLAEQLSDAVLASTRTAAFVVRHDLSILHASGRADALLQSATPLRCHQGRLLADTHGGMPTLAALVAQAIGGDTRQISPPQSLCLHRQGQAALIVSVAPLATPDGPLAVVFVREPETATSAPALQQRFDLTPSEAVVAKALAEGGSLDQIAQSKHVSVNTVKTHIHHIYRKTATSRQGELIALIHGSGGLPPAE
jgi:DNA-binding CsgD family transcriptional regulator